MVQAQFPLEVLVDALGSPSLHYQADELLLRPGPRQGYEEEVGGLGLTVSPFNEQPQRLLLALGDARGNDTTTPELIAGWRAFLRERLSGASQPKQE